jgi:hypothetical protein
MNRPKIHNEPDYLFQAITHGERYTLRYANRLELALLADKLDKHFAVHIGVIKEQLYKDGFYLVKENWGHMLKRISTS